MAIAVRQDYAAAQEQAAAGNKATADAFIAHAETFEATRDYLIANQLTPEQRSAFENMLDEKLRRTADSVRAGSFWSRAAGKATVAGVAIAAVVSAVDLAVQLLHMVHP